MTDELSVGRQLDDRESGGKAVRGGATRTIAYVLGLLVGVAATPFVVRYLGAADFGRLGTVTALVTIVVGLTEGGLLITTIRLYQEREGEEGRELLRQLLGLRLVLAGVATTISMTIALAAGYDGTLIAGVALVAPYLLLGGIFNIMQADLTARLKLQHLAVIELARSLAAALWPLLLVLAGTGLIPFFLGPAISTVAALVLGWWWTRHTISLRARFVTSAWKEMLRDSLPYAMAMAMALMYPRVPLIVLPGLSGDVETGYFAAAYRVVEILAGIPWLVIGGAFPILARAAGTDDDERLAYATARLSEVTLLLGAGLAVTLGVGAGPVIEVIGGDEFAPADDVLALLGISLVGTCLLAAWGHVLLSLERQRWMLIANGAAAVIGTALAIALVDLDGARGGAIAVVITESGLAAVYLMLLVKSGRGLAPRPIGFLRVLAAVAVALAVGLLLPVPVAVATVLALIAFGGTALAVGGVPDELLVEGRAMLRGKR